MIHEEENKVWGFDTLLNELFIEFNADKHSWKL